MSRRFMTALSVVVVVLSLSVWGQVFASSGPGAQTVPGLVRSTTGTRRWRGGRTTATAVSTRSAPGCSTRPAAAEPTAWARRSSLA
jgi:hypothetical protein